MRNAKIDKRHPFAEQGFTYPTSKDGKVFIGWQGKQGMILKAKAAKPFWLTWKDWLSGRRHSGWQS